MKISKEEMKKIQIKNQDQFDSDNLLELLRNSEIRFKNLSEDEREFYQEMIEENEEEIWKENLSNLI